MELIDKEDDLAVAVLDFLQNSLQTLLKLASVFRAGHQSSHVQGEDSLVLQRLRHISADDPLSQALHDGCLADAGLTDEDRIILRLTGQDPDHVADLAVTPDDRIQLLLSGSVHQVCAVLVQCIVGSLRVVACHLLVSSHCGECLQKAFPGNAKLPEELFHLSAWMLQKSQEQMLHRDILISHLLHLILSAYERLVEVLPHIGLAALHLGALCYGLLHPVNDQIFIQAHFFHHL